MLSPMAVSHAPVLRFIQATPDTSANAIASATQRVPSNVRRDLPKLEKAGLIKVEPLRLTDQGIAALAVIDGQAAQANPVRNAPEGFTSLPHHLIQIGELNPRKAFDGVALLELADDILARGLKQNLLVRPTAPLADGSACAVHELVAGERRWRAIGLLIERGDLDPDWPIPVKVEAMDDKAHALAALLENLQRVDLSPLEEAAAFDQLVNMNGWSTAQVAEKVSKTQRFVQLRLQLLKLTDDQKARLEKGDMTVKEALRALANRPEEVDVTPVQLLALALIWTNAYPDTAAHLSYWKKGECHIDAETQPMVAALIEAKLAHVEAPTRYDPKHQLGVTYSGFLALEQKAIELTRAENADARRSAWLAVENAAYAADKAGTDEAMGLAKWLGKPDINSPVVQALIDERLAAERADEERAREREREKVAAQEKAEQAEAAGAALLLKIRTFEAQAPTMSRAEFTAAFNALLIERGYVGPFTIGLWSPGKDAWNRDLPVQLALFDGQGNALAGGGLQFQAMRRLQAIALNHAIGQAVVYSGDDLVDEVEDDEPGQDDDDDGEDPQNEVEFLDIVTDEFTGRYGVEAALALDLTHRAYARVTEDVGEFGSDQGEWTRLDAKMVATGWAEDFPETLGTTEGAEGGQ